MFSSQSGGRRAARKSAGPREGAQLIDSIFARTRLLDEARRYRVLHAWYRLCPPLLARHTRAERVQGTALLVRVATAPWANQLHYQRAALLDELRRTPGAEWIDELR